MKRDFFEELKAKQANNVDQNAAVDDEDVVCPYEELLQFERESSNERVQQYLDAVVDYWDTVRDS